MLIIAALHFVTGKNYRGPWPLFVNGYMHDVLVPFGFYFLLALQDYPLYQSWIFKAVLIFCVTCCVELAQYMGYRVFGSTFDPKDFIAYASGIILAIIFDKIIFPRIFSFWKLDRHD